MAASATEHTDDLELQRTILTAFLKKTYQMIDDPSVNELISWNENGTSFIVWRPDEFSRDLLPKHFKHNNFSSFVRQLNIYGFRKIIPDRFEFAHDCFRRGQKNLLQEIQRRKISQATPVTAAAPPAPPAAAPPAAAANAVTVAVAAPAAIARRTVSPATSGDEQVLSSNSSQNAAVTVLRGTSCTTVAEILEENERLRRENMRVNQELSELKSLWSGVWGLMTNYATSHFAQLGAYAFNAMPVPVPVPGKSTEHLASKHVGVGVGVVAAASNNSMLSEAAAEEEEVVLPKLFGVPIGMKRRHSVESERQERNQIETQSSQQEADGVSDLNSEPLDAGGNQVQQPRPWLELGRF